MKTILVTALALVPGWVVADSVATPPVAGATISPATGALQGLTPEQQKQAEPILTSEVTQRRAIEENKSLSEMQKQVQIGMVHRMALQQIQALKATAPTPAKP